MEGLKKYRWSGHADLLGLQRNDWQTTGEILILFGKGKKKAVKGYEEFVEAGINICKSGCLSVGGFIRSTGGWKVAEDFKRRKHAQEADDRILGDGDFVAQTLREAEERTERKEKLKKDGWGIEKAISRACELSGVSTEGIKRQSRRTKLAQAKSLAIYFANSDLGINGAELSEYFGLTPAAISVSIQRGRKIAGDNEYLII
jgi:putative transposase